MSAGLVHSSCMNYVAYNDITASCSAIDVCRYCSGVALIQGESDLDNCTAVSPSKRYYVSEYYKVKGADQMKDEL